MKLMNNKGFVQKILTVLLAIVLFNFAVPVQSQADFGGKLFQPITDLIIAVSDVAVGLLNHSMLGTKALIQSATLDYDKSPANTQGDGIWALTKEQWMEKYHQNPGLAIKLHYGDEKSVDTSNVEYNSIPYNGTLNEGLVFDRNIDIPNILYCPEYIFANKIAALDVNFINPGEYTGGEQLGKQESIASKLASTVSSWYKAFRNLAIVALLSILVYIGIRIIIGSTAEDKAKYKERIKDWLVAMCLLFAMHYIMAGVMFMSETITQKISDNIDNEICVRVDGYDGETDKHYDITFKTNYMGYIRLMAQSEELGDSLAYIIMYIALIIYTVMFTITYIKRVLFMAFFTIISPLVAMTYPLDKLADGSAQGFNTWFREYMFNALIQPIHLIIYTIIMGSVLSLAVSNPLYGIIALGFMLPAEKFIKKMFRFDKTQSSSALGTVAGGALAMKGLQGVGKLTRSIGSGGGKGGNDKIRTKDSPELIGDKREKDKGLVSPEDILGSEGSQIPQPGNPSFIGPTLPRSGDPSFIGPPPPPRPIQPGNPSFIGPMPQTGNVKRWFNRNMPTFSSAAYRLPYTRLGRTASSLGHQGIRSLKRMPGKAGKIAIKGVKQLPRVAIKTGARAVGVGTMGTLAAGAAVTTGDAKTALSLLGTGAMIGNSIGGALGGRLADHAANSAGGLKQAFSDSWYTEAEKEAQEQAKKNKFDKEWKQREENYKYLKGKNLSDKQAKEFLQDANTQAFLNAGITDINLIYNAQKMMRESNGQMKLDGAVARAQLASKVSDNFKNSDSEQNAFAERMQRKNKNIDTEKLIKEIKKLKSKDY